MTKQTALRSSWPRYLGGLSTRALSGSQAHPILYYLTTSELFSGIGLPSWLRGHQRGSRQGRNMGAVRHGKSNGEADWHNRA